jgi:Arc/MetJ-type ribon-helix-helix transcriptional regulator
MKTKISVSVEEELVNKLEELVNSGKFRNKSHLIEYSVNDLLKKLLEDKKNEIR